MKKIFTLGAALLLAACNKNNNNNTTPSTPTADTTPPVISLNGKTNDTVSLNSTYVDPGATAQDNVDGNISSGIVVTTTMNKDLKGNYQYYYNVKDQAGNAAAQMTRFVYVANDADYLIGAYTAVSNCGASPTFPVTTSLTTSSSVNNLVSFGIPNNVSTITPSIMVNGSAINIPTQTNGASSINGTGTIANKKSFTLTYTATSSNATQGTWNCSVTYTR